MMHARFGRVEFGFVSLIGGLCDAVHKDYDGSVYVVGGCV